MLGPSTISFLTWMVHLAITVIIPSFAILFISNLFSITWVGQLMGGVVIFTVILMSVTFFAPRKGTCLFYLRTFAYFWIQFVFCFPLSLCLLFRPWNPHNFCLGSTTIAPYTKIMGITWEIRGEKHLKTVPGTWNGCILIANHQSEIDLLGLNNIWHHFERMVPVMKSTLFWVWPFGFACWLMGMIYINRSNPKESMRILTEKMKLLKKQKTKMLIYAEGTRNRNCGTMLPFRKGAFRCAVASQCPIIPMVYSPYYFINYREKIFEKGHMIIEVLPPIQTKGLQESDVDKLVTEVRNEMFQVFARLYKETTGQECPPDKYAENKG